MSARGRGGKRKVSVQFSCSVVSDSLWPLEKNIHTSKIFQLLWYNDPLENTEEVFIVPSEELYLQEEKGIYNTL